MEFKVPEALRVEHEELHERLAKATEENGKLGEAAREVAKLLHPHIAKEEAYALPPLGLLHLLAAGRVSVDMGDVLSMTDRLKSELPQLLAEHSQIVAALRAFGKAAREQGKPQCADLSEKLILHAQAEEDVFYPVAILIGEYVRLRLKGQGPGGRERP